MSDKGISDGVMSGKRRFSIHYLLIINYYLLIFLLFSCREPAPQVPVNKLPEVSLSEKSILLNKEFVEFEREEIDHYIDSLKLDMSQTITGLRYKIIKEGDGGFPRKKDKVTFRYSIRTLDNVECEELKNVTKTVELGKGALRSGIEEAVMLLKASGQGWFIIPSYLAYGVPGYKNCVPPWTPVFCEINVINVSY
jgi:hypothetical protein